MDEYLREGSDHGVDDSSPAGARDDRAHSLERRLPGSPNDYGRETESGADAIGQAGGSGKNVSGAVRVRPFAEDFWVVPESGQQEVVRERHADRRQRFVFGRHERSS